MDKYQAYLFDWDGTLCDTLPIWLTIVREILEPYHVTWSDKEVVLRVFGRVRTGFSEAGMPDAMLDEAIERKDAAAHERLPRAPLYKDAKEMLLALKAKHKQLGLITATARPTVTKLLEQHGLADVFDAVVTGDEVIEHKPHPESLEYACKQLGVAKDQAIMLGDSDKDLGAAQNAGIASVLFYPPGNEPFHTLAELQAYHPAYTIRTWQELLDRLQ